MKQEARVMNEGAGREESAAESNGNEWPNELPNRPQL